MNQRFLLLCLVCLLLSLSIHAQSVQLSAACTTASGPGLDWRVAHSRRHFSIQLCTTEGVNLTSSPHVDFAELPYGKLDVTGHLTSINWREEEYKSQLTVSDRGDGTLFSSFVVYAPLKNVQITIKLNGQHIKGSPFKIHLANSDSCSCPMSPEEFKEVYQCPTAVDSKLKEGLARFPSGIHESMILDGIVRMKDPNHAFVQFVIKDGEIHAKDHTDINGFRQFFDRAFSSLARKVRLPDSEFLLNLGDWPLVKLKNKRGAPHTDSHGRVIPMLSGCIDGETADVLMPTWVDTRYIFNEAVENVHEMDATSYGQGSFANKTPKLYWRGRDANAERLRLVEMSQEHPDLIDAGITHYFFFRNNGEEQRLGKVPTVDLLHFWKHKYQLNVDGTVAAYRLMALLAGNSVVFKQDSPYEEWFYNRLQPYVHYIPVKRDLSDLVEKIAWAQEHDDEAQKIARNARLLIRELLTPEMIYCQFFQVLEEYSKLMKYPVVVRPDMDRIATAPHTNYPCSCPLPPPKRARAAKAKLHGEL